MMPGFQAASELLAEDGHRVLSAGTLREGINFLNAEAVDLALLDVRLPDGSGLEHISQIRSAPSSPEVIITGFGDVDGAGLALQNGAWDYLEKTSDIDRVRLPVLRALQCREARQFEGPARLLSRAGVVRERVKCVKDYPGIYRNLSWSRHRFRNPGVPMKDSVPDAELKLMEHRRNQNEEENPGI